MTRPFWLGRAVRNRHRHAIEQASHRWRAGRHDERAVIFDFHTGKDPKNSLFAWPQPSQCDMIEVLSGLSGLRILGDLTDWYESIALDAVSLKAPASGRSEVPTCPGHAGRVSVHVLRRACDFKLNTHVRFSRRRWRLDEAVL